MPAVKTAWQSSVKASASRPRPGAGWHRASRNQAQAQSSGISDADDGLHDGPPDERRRGLSTAAAVQLEEPVKGPAYGQYTDASGKGYGAAQPGRTMNVPKTAMAPKPATTSTVTRGGFGDSVAKQNTMQRSATGTSSRSTGG